MGATKDEIIFDEKLDIRYTILKGRSGALSKVQ